MNTTQRFQKALSQDRQYVRRPQNQSGRGAASRQSHFMPAWETLLGLTVILIIGALLPGQKWGLLNVQPHPFWIIVLAISVRYGAWPGYWSGGVSALAYILLLWTQPATRFQPLTPPELIQPFLMLVVGAGLGELVEARERRVANLETGRQAARSILEALWKRYRTLEQVKTELEKQIAFQSNSIVTLSALGRRLQSLHTPDLHRAVVDLVSTLLEVNACSLYLYHAGQLFMEVGRPESRPGRPRIISAQNPLVYRAISERRVVTIRDQLIQAGPQSIAQDALLMAGPLMLSGGRIYGVVLIESLPFTAFTPATVARFDMILSWASAAIENAGLYQQAQLPVAVNEAGWIRPAPKPLAEVTERQPAHV